MNFGLAIKLSIEISNKSSIIQSFSENLESFFLEKQYGEGIKTFTIGIVCNSPQFDQFYKEKKPKYTKGIKIINPDGIPFTLEDDLEYNLKIDFEIFKNADEHGAKEILAREILASLPILENMKSKIKDFDIDRFAVDLRHYFNEHGLLS